MCATAYAKAHRISLEQMVAATALDAAGVPLIEITRRQARRRLGQLRVSLAQRRGTCAA
jgi:hypothetical protein